MNAFVCRIIATAVGAAIGQILFNKYEDEISDVLDNGLDKMKRSLRRLKKGY